MKEITSTEAARRFAEVLDAVEHDHERFVVRRRGRVIARIEPAVGATWGDVVRIMREHPVDPDFARDVASVRRLLVTEERDWGD